MLLQKLTFRGRGGGQMVIVFAFNSDDSCSNPVVVYSFFKKMGHSRPTFILFSSFLYN